MALIFSIAECGISSTIMANSKKQTSICSDNSGHIRNCAYRIEQVLENSNSADRDDACRDCRSDLEDFVDNCLDNTDAQAVHDGLEEACGAVIIGMSLFSIILAVLVALATAMN